MQSRILVIICGVAAALAAVGTAGGSRVRDVDTELSSGIDQRLAAVSKTRRLLDDKYAARSGDLRRRVRAAYKLVRAGYAPLWTDAKQRAQRARRLGAARRILRRDVRELALLRDEIGIARRAQTRLSLARNKAAGARRPQHGDITPPVPGAIATRFGRYRGRKTRATLTRRGIQLVSRRGAAVTAPAPGRVRFVGPVRGISQAVVMDHGGFLTVVGRLDTVDVRVGDELQARQRIGSAAGRRVYLELRIDDDLGGLPIDPEPLMVPLRR